MNLEIWTMQKLKATSKLRFRKREIGLAELLDLDKLYKHLEEKAIDYTYPDIANLFQKIRDKMHVEKKADLDAIENLTLQESNILLFLRFIA